MRVTQRRRLSSSQARTAGVAGLASVSLALALVGCSKGSSSARDAVEPAAKGKTDVATTPQGSEKGGVIIPAGMLPKLATGATTAELPDGNLIPLTYVGGEAYLTVEGTFSETSYRSMLTEEGASTLSEADKAGRVGKEINAVLRSIEGATPVLAARAVPEVGYFRFLLPYARFENLGRLKNLSRTVLLNPVVLDAQSHQAVRALSAGINQDLKDAGLAAAQGDAAYSGLLRIGVKEFEAIVASEIAGAKVDGSGVRVGVTDTGVTYNHPAFEDAQGNSRVSYMKEFTGEGTIYFSPKARFEVRVPTDAEIRKNPALKEALLLTAEYLAPGGASQAPAADDFQIIENAPIRVSKELRAILTKAGSGARLGVLAETAFDNAQAGENVDINANGKIDDNMLVIHVPSEKGAGVVYLDLAGTGDFRASRRLGDFNATKSLVTSFQEKFGFDLRETQIADKKGEPVDVVSAGIVGYDPGNHGSHVSGIIGGRKTLSNAADDTYARGVAPAADLMVNRVCANNGGCNATEAFIDLALNGAEIVNMSLGGLSPFNDGYGVQETIINRLVMEKNVLFVISAGNSGPGRQTVGSPSTARLSLSVGASASRSLINRQYQWPGSTKPAVATGTDENDFMLFFSSRGPTAAGGFKPNLAAPGTELSSVQLNAAPGARAGLDVYWGTSMAAPTAAGAAALLLDAVKKYNAANPSSALPTDALTLRAALIESAQAFDASILDPKTGKSTKGRYTWIDQGQGLLNLPRAWATLKAQAATKAKPSVVAKEEGAGAKGVALDYEVRVLAKLPNGLDYTGASPRPVAGDISPDAVRLEPAFGKGVWIDPAAKEALYTVQIARRLPAGALKRKDAGELMRQLNTSAETFVLETTVYGSDSNWLKAGVLNRLDCKDSTPQGELRLVGQAAVDSFNEDGTGTSVGLNASNLFVCVDRAALRALPPGDHGAIVKAYRKDTDGKKEAVPAFEVPVYLTKPHKTLEGSERYEISGVARSFDVERNYVVVPKGTSVVNVSLEVPELKADGSGCAGVELMAYEAGNTAQPKEIAPRTKAIASNCALTGAPGGARKIGYSRFNPTPGVWDLHVFGRYQFEKSPYKLTVEYAKVATGVDKISGLPSVLNGKFNLTVQEATFEAKPDGEKSDLVIDTLLQTTRPVVKNEQRLDAPTKAGKVARTYDESVKAVTINTFGATGNDIDLEVYECEDLGLKDCALAASSGTATDVETATFTPVKGKFYKAVVVGYSVPAGETEFTLEERLSMASIDEGTVSVAQGASANEYVISYALDVSKSTLLKDERFTSGDYSAAGELEVRTKDSSLIANVPVAVSAKDDVSTSASPVATATPAR